VLLVLWDIDGTLVDSAGHGRYAFEDAYRALAGRPFEGPIEMAGRTDHQIAMEMLDGLDGEPSRLLDELVAALAARKELIRREGRTYPGVPATLSALARRDDVAQSLLTGNVEVNAAVKLGAFGLERWLDFELGAYGSDPHEARSDLVAIARERAQAKLGEPVEPVLVGDTPLDVRAAREAGARAVAVATGFSDLEQLRAAEPDALLTDLSDTDRAVAAIAAPLGGAQRDR
jgi:phosphoglycolate phosphatase-like HAD superfamily hydrolase